MCVKVVFVRCMLPFASFITTQQNYTVHEQLCVTLCWWKWNWSNKLQVGRFFLFFFYIFHGAFFCVWVCNTVRKDNSIYWMVKFILLHNQTQLAAMQSGVSTHEQRGIMEHFVRIKCENKLNHMIQHQSYVGKVVTKRAREKIIQSYRVMDKEHQSRLVGVF